MKRHFLQIVVLASLALFTSLPANAGWNFESFNVYSEGAVGSPSGTVNYNVNFWLLSDRYASHFTMYKVCGDTRIYVTIQGASYASFKQQNAKWDDGKVIPGAIDPAAGFGSPGSITWVDSALYDGDDITFDMWCADFFRKNGKPLQVSVTVAPHPGRKYGMTPNVDVNVNNGVLAGLRVTYPRVSATAAGTALNLKNGVVTATCGDGVARDKFQYGPIGWIGSLQVGGGVLSETTSYQGIMDIITRGRRHPKMAGLLQGGSMNKTIVSGGRIQRIFSNNGIGTTGASGGVGATAPVIGAGWQIALPGETDVPTPFGIGRVVMQRGGNNARILAGSDPASSSRADWAFQGEIKKVICKDKGGGDNTGVNGCTFVTLGEPKIVNKTTLTGCKVENPHGTINL